MAIVYIPENKGCGPLTLEPYKSFNKQFEKRADDLEDRMIKISIFNNEDGFKDGFDVDDYFCKDVTLKFMFSHICGDHYGGDILIHHTIEYGFDSSFVESQEDMAEGLKAKADYFYIPGIKQLELSYRLTSKSIQVVFDVISEENNVQTVCNQLISQDIAIYSRGWWMFELIHNMEGRAAYEIKP